MKLSPRKQLMKSLREAGLGDFRTPEEMASAHALYALLKKGDSEPLVERKKRKKAAKLEVEKTPA